VGLTGAGVEVTESGTAFPFFERPKTLQMACCSPLDQTRFGGTRAPVDSKNSPPPLTSIPAQGKATRRPASINSNLNRTDPENPINLFCSFRVFYLLNPRLSAVLHQEADCRRRKASWWRTSARVSARV